MYDLVIVSFFFGIMTGMVLYYWGEALEERKRKKDEEA